MTIKSVLYIYLGDFSLASGVTNKLKGLFHSFDQKNIHYVLFSARKEISSPTFLSRNEYLLPNSFLKDLNAFYRELDKFIVEQPAFDAYFFRYPLASSRLYQLVKKHKNKFVFEHNTKELPEIKQQGISWVRKFKFRPTPSYCKLILNSLVKPVFNEIYYAKKILKHARKGISVTHEISEYEKKVCPIYVCNTVSNGVDVNSINFYKRNFKKGDALNIIMLANSNVDWHGVDIVLNAFLSYRDNNIKLFFIGDFDEKVKRIANGNPNIIFPGFLSPTEFQTYLKNAHLGLGSFAAFRKQLEEGCSLKVREYLASGLPVFLGYKDTDVMRHKSLKNFCYYIEARKEPINWLNIYNWAAKQYLNENLNIEIRQEAINTIDFSVKTSELLVNLEIC